MRLFNKLADIFRKYALIGEQKKKTKQECIALTVNKVILQIKEHVNHITLMFEFEKNS